MHIVKYRDSLQWAVQKRLNRLRCSIGMLRWVGPGNMYYMGYSKGHLYFGGVWPIKKHCIVQGKLCQKGMYWS